MAVLNDSTSLCTVLFVLGTIIKNPTTIVLFLLSAVAGSIDAYRCRTSDRKHRTRGNTMTAVVNQTTACLSENHSKKGGTVHFNWHHDRTTQLKKLPHVCVCG